MERCKQHTPKKFVNDILFDGRIKMAEEEDGYIEGLMTNGLPTGEVRVVLFESVDYRERSTKISVTMAMASSDT